MPATVYVGCCGWSYLREHDFPFLRTTRYSSKLQAYAHLLKLVEVNSSFYRVPKITTAEKWRQEADAVDKQFTFTVKAYQGITHIDRFGRKSETFFAQVKDICASLESTLILFQSPSSFIPSTSNIKKLTTFFHGIDRGGLECIWEPRGKWYNLPHVIAEVCENCDLIHCVDPFRNEPLAFGKTNSVYFRLHGFGSPAMYNYTFSTKELEHLRSIVSGFLPSRLHVYVLFNNVFCYENASSFAEQQGELNKT